MYTKKRWIPYIKERPLTKEASFSLLPNNYNKYKQIFRYNYINKEAGTFGTIGSVVGGVAGGVMGIAGGPVGVAMGALKGSSLGGLAGDGIDLGVDYFKNRNKNKEGSTQEMKQVSLNTAVPPSNTSAPPVLA